MEYWLALHAVWVFWSGQYDPAGQMVHAAPDAVYPAGHDPEHTVAPAAEYVPAPQFVHVATVELLSVPAAHCAHV